MVSIRTRFRISVVVHMNRIINISQQGEYPHSQQKTRELQGNDLIVNVVPVDGKHYTRMELRGTMAVQLNREWLTVAGDYDAILRDDELAAKWLSKHLGMRYTALGPLAQKMARPLENIDFGVSKDRTGYFTKPWSHSVNKWSLNSQVSASLLLYAAYLLPLIGWTIVLATGIYSLSAKTWFRELVDYINVLAFAELIITWVVKLMSDNPTLIRDRLLFRERLSTEQDLESVYGLSVGMIGDGLLADQAMAGRGVAQVLGGKFCCFSQQYQGPGTEAVDLPEPVIVREENIVGLSSIDSGYAIVCAAGSFILCEQQSGGYYHKINMINPNNSFIPVSPPDRTIRVGGS